MAGNRSYQNNRNYNNNGGNYNNNRNYQNNEPSGKAPSGATFGVCQKGEKAQGKCFVTAWRKKRKDGGLLALSAFEITGSVTSNGVVRERQTIDGKTFVPMLVTILDKESNQKTITSALYNLSEKRMFLKEFSEVITKGTGSGY